MSVNGGGVPQSQVLAKVSGPRSFQGGTPDWGHPSTGILSSQDRIRVPPGQDKTGAPPGQDRTGVPPVKTGLVCPQATTGLEYPRPRQDWGTPSQDRSRAVCLLRLPFIESFAQNQVRARLESTSSNWLNSDFPIHSNSSHLLLILLVLDVPQPSGCKRGNILVWRLWHFKIAKRHVFVFVLNRFFWRGYIHYFTDHNCEV